MARSMTTCATAGPTPPRKKCAPPRAPPTSTNSSASYPTATRPRSALLKGAEILILDEATSSLDSKSEKFVQEAIDALLGGNRTVFVIAHRLSTIRRADRILVLEGGRLTQQGTHEELLQQGGLYKELLELQIQA